MFNRKHRVAIFDVDNSTFDTHAFHTCLSFTVTRMFPSISQTDYRAEIPLYDVGSQGYDLEAHLAYYGKSFDELRPHILAAMSGHTLMYDDAVSAFKYLLDRADTDIWSLTVGVPKTQQLKLDLQCYELRRRLDRRSLRIPHEIISGDKGAFLANHWAKGFQMGKHKYKTAILVDDNPSQLQGMQPKPGLEIYQIVRPLAKYGAIGRSDIREISDLRHIV